MERHLQGIDPRFRPNRARLIQEVDVRGDQALPPPAVQGYPGVDSDRGHLHSFRPQPIAQIVDELMNHVRPGGHFPRLPLFDVAGGGYFILVSRIVGDDESRPPGFAAKLHVPGVEMPLFGPVHIPGIEPVPQRQQQLPAHINREECEQGPG